MQICMKYCAYSSIGFTRYISLLQEFHSNKQIMENIRKMARIISVLSLAHPSYPAGDHAPEHRPECCPAMSVQRHDIAVVGGGVMFCKIVRFICRSGCPVYLELALFDAVAHPVVAHVDGSRALLFDVVVVVALVCVLDVYVEKVPFESARRMH